MSILQVLNHAVKVATEAVGDVEFLRQETYEVVLATLLEDWTTNGNIAWNHTDVLILQGVTNDCVTVATTHSTEMQQGVYKVLLKAGMTGWIKSRSKTLHKAPAATAPPHQA